MADLIRIKGGSGNVPTLQDRELAYSKVEKALYIGTENGNVRLCSAEDVTEINAEINNINTEINNIKVVIAEINSAIASINARLDALEPDETPSE